MLIWCQLCPRPGPRPKVTDSERCTALSLGEDARHLTPRARNRWGVCHCIISCQDERQRGQTWSRVQAGLTPPSRAHFWLWALRLRIEMVYCFKVELGRRMGEEGDKERKWWCGRLACRVQGSWLQWNAGGDNACGRTLHPTLRSNAEKGIRCPPIIRWWCVRAPSYHTENWHISLFFNYTFRKG